MSTSNNQSSFIWNSAGDTKPFPLDYSLRQLEQKWGEHRSKIHKRIMWNPLFDRFHRWMRYSNPDEANDKCKSRSIPVELEPFFKEFYFFCQAPAYNNKILKGSIPTGFTQDFAFHLNEKIISEEKNLKNSPAAEDPSASSLYLYRRLYENEAFKNDLSLEYWDREYERRCQTIKELSQKLPQEEQIHQLKTMLEYMDTQIAYLLQRIPSDIPEIQEKTQESDN